MKVCTNCLNGINTVCAYHYSGLCKNHSNWKPNYPILEAVLKLACEEIALSKGFTSEIIMEDLINCLLTNY